MGREGYIKDYREVLDNPIICKDSDHFAIWHYLRYEAKYKPSPSLFGGKKIMLQPGQLTVGRRQIAEYFGISESKVQRVLKCFESEHLIEQQTSTKNRLISMVGWEDEQKGEQQTEQPVNNNCTTTEQRLNTPKEGKKERRKESNIDSLEISFGSGELQAAIRDWIRYKDEMRQGYKPTGLKSLLTRIQKQAGEYGEKAVIDVIGYSMSNRYQGIVWDRIQKAQKPAGEYKPQPNTPKKYVPPPTKGKTEMPEEVRERLNKIF